MRVFKTCFHSLAGIWTTDRATKLSVLLLGSAFNCALVYDKHSLRNNSFLAKSKKSTLIGVFRTALIRGLVLKLVNLQIASLFCCVIER